VGWLRFLKNHSKTISLMGYTPSEAAKASTSLHSAIGRGGKNNSDISTTLDCVIYYKLAKFGKEQKKKSGPDSPVPPKIASPNGPSAGDISSTTPLGDLL
jgi:hypothetical protein